MKFGPIISVLLLISVIISVLLILEIRNIQEYNFTQQSTTSEEQKALVTHVGQGWSENSLNLSEIIFDVDVYNYGYNEAKNVQVDCELYSADSEGNYLSETPILRTSSNIGNVASTSYKEVQVYAIKNEEVDDYSLSYCFITSCENCEILDERLK